MIETWRYQAIDRNASYSPQITSLRAPNAESFETAQIDESRSAGRNAPNTPVSAARAPARVATASTLMTGPEPDSDPQSSDPNASSTPIDADALFSEIENGLEDAGVSADVATIIRETAFAPGRKQWQQAVDRLRALVEDGQ